MDFTYDILYDRWHLCTISYTFGTLPDCIGVYRYISTITSCDRLVDHINSMPQYCCVPGYTFKRPGWKPSVTTYIPLPVSGCRYAI